MDIWLWIGLAIEIWTITKKNNSYLCTVKPTEMNNFNSIILFLLIKQFHTAY
jgi:hypothetical protein